MLAALHFLYLICSYRLRKHREAQGVPDHRYSQPRSLGAHAPIQQKYFSFDEAHPAIATEHCLRSPGQNHMLQVSVAWLSSYAHPQF